VTGAALSYASAQARLALALAAGYDAPALGRLASAVNGGARVEEMVLAGVPATAFSPGRGQGPWPTLVLVPGVTRAGRQHAALVGVGRGLASAGHVVLVVEPAGLVSGELTPSVTDAVRAAAEAAATRPGARGGRVALAGVSGGATLALLAAAELAERVSAVAALAPCCDIREALRLITTGVYRRGDGVAAFATGDFFKLVVARSAVAWVPDGSDRAALRALLASHCDDLPDPLARVREVRRHGLGPSACAVVELLANEDPGRFDELYAALPAEARTAADALSPVDVADRIEAPVSMVVAREDKYIPLEDALAFARRCRRLSLTVLDSLVHAVPSVSPGAAHDLARLDVAAVRLLVALRPPSYSGQ
jgi:pimeloyl-ACP methyl ester carboxylesterase